MTNHPIILDLIEDRYDNIKSEEEYNNFENNYKKYNN